VTGARSRLVTGLFAASDVLMTLLALAAAHRIRASVTGLLGTWPGPVHPFDHFVPLLAVVVPLWLVVFRAAGLYGDRAARSLRPEIGRIATAVTIGGLLMSVAIVALRASDLSRPTLLCFLLLDGVFVVVGRGLVRLIVSDPTLRRRVIIAGDRRGVLQTAASFSAHRDWGVEVVGVASDGSWTLPDNAPYRFIGPVDTLHLFARSEPVDEVVLVPSTESPEQLLAYTPLFARLEHEGIVTRLLVNFLPQPDLSLERLGDMPLLTMAPSSQRDGPLMLRRCADVVLASALLALLSPVLLIIAAVIRLGSPGPVLFRQTRCGLNGRPFTFLKFRSMRLGSELLKPVLAPWNEMDGPAFKMSIDPRVTRVGWFLRHTSLDELPQLWNILKGEMSFVGPRPAVVEEVLQYEPWQRRRLTMQPGLTCLWQISGRSDLTFDEWMRLDLEYIDNWSLWLDVKIAFKTIPAVLVGRGAK